MSLKNSKHKFTEQLLNSEVYIFQIQYKTVPSTSQTIVVVKWQVLKLWTNQNLQVLFPLFVLQVSAVDAASVPPLSSASTGRGLIFVNKSRILGKKKAEVYPCYIRWNPKYNQVVNKQRF